MNTPMGSVVGSPQQIGVGQADVSRHALTICFLSSKHPPLDKRVFDKEAVSLARAGFRVIHLAPGEAGEKLEQEVRIITYRPPRGIIGRILQIPRLYRAAANLSADCYHCNEVDSWLVGVLLKLFRHKQVVFDVHEHYPSTFAQSRFPGWSHSFVAGTIRLIFRLLVRYTDRLVFAKRSVVSDFRGSEVKQVLVQNFTSLAFQDPDENRRRREQDPASSSRVTAIHLGLFSRLRGWPQLLEAVQILNMEKLHLTIIGTFNDGSKADFDQQVAALGLSDRIFFREWLPFEEAYRYIQASDIGLVLFQPGVQNHVYALPHKMFDYMLAELPVIAPAFAEEVASIISEADCGVLVDPSDPADIARALGLLVSDAGERRRLGENGRHAVLAHYNWEAEAEKLVTMYQEIAAALHSTPS